MPNTVSLHRVFTTTAEKIYRAFTDADALSRWLPPNGFTCTVHQLDAKVGGTRRLSFRNFTSGNSHSFGGEYLELIPHSLVSYSDTFDDKNLPGKMKTTIRITKVSVGTEVHITQEGVPDVIPIHACYLGWQESLRFLAKIVEPDIQE